METFLFVLVAFALSYGIVSVVRWVRFYLDRKC